jgi:SAM-dependent methyltransferase
MDRLLDTVIAYYEGKLASFGTTARGVDWKDEASQRLRFEQLVRALSLDTERGCTLIDFGCGYGALLPYLRERGFAGTYAGFDRAPAMIAQARAAHPDAFFTDHWDELPHADYVVASGVFNVRLTAPSEAWRAYVLRSLQMIHEKAGRGWAANFLTSYADEERKRDDLYYADPLELFDWCKRSLARAVALLHDYPLYEFTLGVRRDAW